MAAMVWVQKLDWLRDVGIVTIRLCGTWVLSYLATHDG